MTALLPLLPLLVDRIPPMLAQVLATEGIGTAAHDPRDARGRFVLFDGRGGAPPVLAAGQTAIDVAPLRDEFAEDPFAALADENTVRGSWEIGHLTLSEEIARVDKRGLERRLAARLRHLVEAAGGVWLRIGAYPFPYRSAFNLRIDHDDYEPGDFRTTLHALSGHEQATSHFVCAIDFERAPQALAALADLDVGAHGYRHHTYRERDLNLANIRRGIEVLEQAGLRPSGFVAPHGRFNAGLLAALEALGIPHSSEFGLAYDGLPFFPRGTSVLQIPVHPVCLGLFLEAAQRPPRAGGEPLAPAAAAELAAAYFERLARARYLAGEPVFFYGHPTGRLGRYPLVVRRLLEAIDSLPAIWPTTLTRFASWWRERLRTRYVVREAADGLQVEVLCRPADFALSGEVLRGELVARVPLDEPVVHLRWEHLAYERATRDATPRPTRVDQRQGLRGWLRQAIDWEKVTPVEDIDTRDWRGWMKKTLRRVRN